MPATGGKYGSKDTLMPSGQRKVESLANQEEFAKIVGDIATQTFAQTQPLRDASTQALTSFMQTGNLPPALQTPYGDLYAVGRHDLEQQYGVARDQILGTNPMRGGQLSAQLADLSMERAADVGRLGTNIWAAERPLRAQLFQNTLSTGYGQAPISMSGLLGSAGQFGSAAGLNMQEQLGREAAAKEEWQEIGQLAGTAGLGT